MIDPRRADSPPKRNWMAGRPSNQSGDKLVTLPHHSPTAPSPSIDADNGEHPPVGSSNDLESRHFQLTKELFELQTLLRTREGLSSGRVGHVRQQARELEKQIETIELALGAIKVEALASGKPAPPKSRHFLSAFYQAAKQQLPAELIARLERAAATKEV
jgi:hypothetical protein